MKKGKYTRSSSALHKALTALTLLLAALAIGLGGMATSRLLGGHREQQALEALSQMLPDLTRPPARDGPQEGGLIAWRGPEEAMLPRYASLHEQNGDLFGWVSIDGTRIDYPVMHTPEEPEKYLHRDFSGEYAYAGTPFLEGSNGPDSHQLLLYGHNMANGSLFHDLFRYADPAFWEEHPAILLDTLHDRYEFEVMAVLQDRVYLKTEDVFKFYQFGENPSEEEFREAVEYYRANALYDTGVTAEYGDQLLALVTCAYHVEDGRFVVIARKTEKLPA